MAKIVIHAGMPKTGSTSIQRWIVEQRDDLHRQHGVQILVANRRTPGTPSDGVRLEPYENEADDVSSNWLLWTWFAADRPPDIPRRFFEDLSELADEHATVLITAEGLSHAFTLDELFILGCERLAERHDVVVAIYVRPQHGAIESDWRQAGYKHRERRPSQWVRNQTRRLRYLRVLDAFRDLAPSVTLGMRPFVPGLLDGGSPVKDFARRFLVLDDEQADLHANPTLPLELVNLLRHAPDGWFWTWTENVDLERYPRERVAEVFAGLEIPESPRIHRSRLVVREHCHTTFEHENQELIRRLDWPIAEFVPHADGLQGSWDLTELDTLWEPEASASERALIYHTLRRALD